MVRTERLARARRPATAKAGRLGRAVVVVVAVTLAFVLSGCALSDVAPAGLRQPDKEGAAAAAEYFVVLRQSTLQHR